MRPLVLVLLSACSVDDDAYRNKVYTCDLTNPDTTQCGTGYTCYGAAVQLGSPDFCTPICSVSSGSAVCTQGSALQKCSPRASQCPQGMSCVRTNLIADEGVCLPIATCTSDQDCRDPVRRACFSSEMTRTYARRTDIQKDHEFCYQPGCAGSGEACTPGTTCLPDVLGAGAPNVCAPDCDSNRRCPPNFICSSLFSQGNPHPFCIPGFLGFRCTSDLDCVVGTCQSPGGPHNVCATPCTTDADCASFNNQNFVLPATFVCQRNTCLSPTLTLLDFCTLGQDATDCQMGETCKQVFPSSPPGSGICVQTCAAGGSCSPKGGFPQSCVNLTPNSGAAPVCLIGVFGIPCQSDANCVTPLHCLAPIPAVPTFKQCTIACQTQTDCTLHPSAGTDTYCAGAIDASAARVCVGKGEAGARCIDPIECKSGICTCPASTGCSSATPGTCM
jgi:hypothetical protein